MASGENKKTCGGASGKTKACGGASGKTKACGKASDKDKKLVAELAAR